MQTDYLDESSFAGWKYKHVEFINNSELLFCMLASHTATGDKSGNLFVCTGHHNSVKWETCIASNRNFGEDSITGLYIDLRGLIVPNGELSLLAYGSAGGSLNATIILVAK